MPATEQKAAGGHQTISVRFLVPFAILWLAVAIPLLTLGYGSDPDSWLVARVGEILWNTHVYTPSRSSGFPLFEIGISPLVHTGRYWAANAFPLLGGINLLASLAFMAKRGHFRHAHLVLLFMGFLPVILKDATSTIDYVITLSILSWAYVALTAERYVATVVLVGLACGFRPQTIIYFAPTCLYILHRTRDLKRSFLLGALGVATAIVAYSPVLFSGGIRSGYKDYELGVSGQILMFGYNGMQVLGILPTLVLAGMIVWVVRARRKGAVVGSPKVPHLRFHAGVFITYGLVFAAMPHEPEYLLPTVLSLVVVIDALFDRRLMIAATLAVLSYHAFRIEAVGGQSGHRKLALGIKQGYLARDVSVRLFLVSTREALTNFEPDRPTLLMFGSDWATPVNPAWEEVERFVVYRRKGTDFYVSDALDDQQIDAWRSKGVRVVLWRGFAKDFLVNRGANEDWKKKVDVVDSLDEFLGAKIEGEPMWPSE